MVRAICATSEAKPRRNRCATKMPSAISLIRLIRRFGFHGEVGVMVARRPQLGCRRSARPLSRTRDPHAPISSLSSPKGRMSCGTVIYSAVDVVMIYPS
jgi:hypothetical protein